MRSCGQCSACCTVMGIDKLDKPAFVACQHLSTRPRTTKCCTAYAERPEECGTFKCGWLRGAGTSKDRPDKIGLVMVDHQNKVQVYRTKGTEWTPRAAALLQGLVQRALVIWVQEDTRSILGGPPRAMQQVLTKLASLKETA